MSWWDKKVETLKGAVEAEKLNRGHNVRSVCIHGDTDCVRCASDDFDNQATAGANWQALDENDVKRVVYALPEEIREMMRRHPGQVVIAGGFIRALVAGENIHDIDVFVPSEKNAKDWVDEVYTASKYEKKDKHYYIGPDAKSGAAEVQVVYRYPFKESYEVPDQFDYTIVKAAVWFDEGDKKRESNYVSVCHERFYRDIARKMLVYECDRDVERIESIPRLLKYIGYGYSIDPDSLAELVVKTCLSMDLSKGFEGMLKQLGEAYKPTGSGENWADMTKKYVKPKPKPAPVRSHDYSYGS